jgi:galactose mutarotase-like enzyme
MIELNNNVLRILIHRKGAEIQSVFHQQHQLEYIWNGNPEHWGKHAPVLFPVVGQLKENSYRYRHKMYHLPRHGFARDMEFDMVTNTASSASLLLNSNDDTCELYPFLFSFQINYSIEGNRLTNEYVVTNNGNDTLFFSVGGHPAFNVPLVADTRFDDYYLELEKPETLVRWPLDGGLLQTHPQPFMNNEKIIPLSHSLFSNDAVVLKHLQSSSISLKSKRTTHGLMMRFEGFPFFGIWAAKNAPFVCLEPWCGIADSLYHNQQLEEKEGIISLAAKDTWSARWSVELF